MAQSRFSLDFLRDLGTYYHAKAEAIAAADNIESFLSEENSSINAEHPVKSIPFNEPLKSIEADNLIVLSNERHPIVGPLSFSLKAPFKLALIGTSGEGKSSLMQVLLGFLPYQGSLKINGIEFNQLNITDWQKQVSWIGQHPYLLNSSVRDNILLGNPHASNEELQAVICKAQLIDVVAKLPEGLDTLIGEDAIRLSIGQAQRVALARAMLKSCQLLILDEPTASLDQETINHLERHNIAPNTITITHQSDDMQYADQVWQLAHGQLNCNVKEITC